MKKYILILSTIFLVTIASAQIGTYQCSAVDSIKQTYELIINFDSNQITYKLKNGDTQPPSHLKILYGKSVYCGYSPSNDSEVSCPFETNYVISSGYISKSLYCEKRVGDATLPITIGSVYFNTKTLKGTVVCHLRESIPKNFILSECIKSNI
ncbi:MAG: hypothetical protein QE271_05050 [Bacteriovoracaceae bacterium]|nr:hypothetical protein [Bacteriovoracaceae bacterium]